jgi:hypothetical protein
MKAATLEEQHTIIPTPAIAATAAIVFYYYTLAFF